MSSGQADISNSARQLYAMLRNLDPVLPQLAALAEHRAGVRAGFDAYVRRALDGFDGSVDEIEMDGIPCRQLTPAGWDGETGLCIQYAYGGGFISGSTYEDQIIAAPLARYCGARVVMLEYDLSPERPYPAPQRQMRTLYPALLDAYGAARLVVCGESAGGNLALGLLQHLRDTKLDRPLCAVLLSPWCDLANRGDSHAFNEGRDPTLTNAYVRLASEWHAQQTPLDDPGISPLYGAMHDLPPVMLTTGSSDLLLSQCLRLARRLHGAGVACDLRVWEGMWHVFEFYPIAEADRSLREIGAFVRAHSAA